jgi:hypothetical protein
MRTLSIKFTVSLARSVIAPLGVLLVLLPLAVGCGGFGSAKVTGHLSGKTPNVGGTVYAYTDSVPRRSGDTPNKRVVVVMSGAHFNPSIDYGAGNKEGMSNVQQAFSANDLIIVVFHDAGNLRTGARFSGDVEKVLLLGGHSAAPNAPKLGSLQPLDVTLTSVELFGKAGRVKGNLDLYVSKQSHEDPSALTGHLRVDFDAPLMDASVARSNIKLYGAGLFALMPLNLL